MKAFSVCFAAATLALTTSLSTATAAAETETWTYKPHEADLFPPQQWFRSYPDCGGQSQSPVDISLSAKTTTQASAHATLPLQLSGSCPNYNIKQFWESFKAETAPTNNSTSATCAATVNGKAYNFAQIHFHAPSEHTLRGKAFDGEVHFVHKAADDTIAVIGLFLQTVKRVGQGKNTAAAVQSDPFFCNFLAQIRKVNETNPVTATLGDYAHTVQTSLHKGRVFNYPGSLTTPPCSPVVDWWVLETPLQISEGEFRELHAELSRIGAADAGKNARPTQPLNGRTITVY